MRRDDLAEEIGQLCGIDKTNVGFVATSSFVQDANLKPDDIPNSLSLVNRHTFTMRPVFH